MHPIVIVEWLDAHTTENDEIPAEDAEKEVHFGYPSFSSGFLIKSDKKGVSLATDRLVAKDGSVTWRGATFIPRGMVVSERKLRQTKARR